MELPSSIDVRINTTMKQTAKEIYDQYRYELDKIRLLLEAAPDNFASEEAFERLALEIDRLDALIDLYAYLLVQHSR